MLLIIWLLLGIVALVLVAFTYRGKEKMLDVYDGLWKLGIISLMVHLIVIYTVLPLTIPYSVPKIKKHLKNKKNEPNQ